VTAAHIDVVADPRPGSRGYLKWYWTKGPGLAKWRLSPHPWTALRRHLLGKVPAQYLDATVSAWFEDVFGYPPSARGGNNPVGKG
jgi:hypothetical protein